MKKPTCFPKEAGMDAGEWRHSLVGRVAKGSKTVKTKKHLLDVTRKKNNV